MKLLNRIAWSGQGDHDLDNPQDRMRAYELVMTEGTEDDVRTHIDLDVLLGMWNTTWLAAPPLLLSAVCAAVFL